MTKKKIAFTLSAVLAFSQGGQLCAFNWNDVTAYTVAAQDAGSAACSSVASVFAAAKETGAMLGSSVKDSSKAWIAAGGAAAKKAGAAFNNGVTNGFQKVNGYMPADLAPTTNAAVSPDIGGDVASGIARVDVQPQQAIASVDATTGGWLRQALSYTKDHKYGIALGSTAVLVGGRVFYNWLEINRIENRYKKPELVIGDLRDSERRMFNWRLDHWQTAYDLQQNRQEVKQQLELDINNPHVFPQAQASTSEKQNMLAFLHKVKNEQEALWVDIKHLEGKYLNMFTFGLFDTGFGIQRRYKNAYADAGPAKDFYDDFISMEQWTNAERDRMQRKMEAAVFKHPNRIISGAQYIFKPNFYRAAKIWWRLSHMYVRLEIIADIVGELAGRSSQYMSSGANPSRVVFLGS